MLSADSAENGTVGDVNGGVTWIGCQSGGWNMTIFLIGIVTVTALVSVIAAALANESNAQRRRVLRDRYDGSQAERPADYVEVQQAA